MSALRANAAARSSFCRTAWFGASISLTKITWRMAVLPASRTMPANLSGDKITTAVSKRCSCCASVSDSYAFCPPTILWLGFTGTMVGAAWSAHNCENTLRPKLPCRSDAPTAAMPLGWNREVSRCCITNPYLYAESVSLGIFHIRVKLRSWLALLRYNTLNCKSFLK